MKACAIELLAQRAGDAEPFGFEEAEASTLAIAVKRAAETACHSLGDRWAANDVITLNIRIVKDRR